MPLSPLGILHTLVAATAVFSGFYLCWRDKQITSSTPLGVAYLIATIIAAASALAIYKHGSFNAAHGLAVLTILAVVVGTIAEKTSLLGGLNKYFVALCFSGTLLFHLLPTATEILTRFPMDAPLVSSFEDELLQRTFLVIVITFVAMFAIQLNWLRKQD
jgi:uncharacterized membrane protein